MSFSSSHVHSIEHSDDKQRDPRGCYHYLTVSSGHHVLVPHRTNQGHEPVYREGQEHRDWAHPAGHGSSYSLHGTHERFGLLAGMLQFPVFKFKLFKGNKKQEVESEHHLNIALISL